MIEKFDIANKKQPNWFFNIRRIKLDYHDYDESVPHQHHFYEFLFLEKGEGIHIIDDKKYKAENNTIHFLSPNHVHHLTLTGPSEGFVCMFKEELFYINNENNQFLEEVDLFSNWNKNPVLKINGDQAK